MSTYDHPVPTELRPPNVRAVDTPTTSEGVAWAWAGFVAGLLGLATFVVAPMVVTEWTDELMSNNELLAVQLADSELIVWVTQVLTSMSALLLVIFGAGLRRRLAAQEPASSLVPTIAFSGTLLTAAACLVGGGISTELFWSLTQDVGATDPDTLGAHMSIFNTIAWVWAGFGMSAGAVGVAALRHGSIQRWIGWVSAVLAAIVLASQLAPVQYLALLPGSLWLVVVGIGLARRERIG
ncbi:MAG: hypothetical protein ACYC2O_05600 [Microthrixaceae bacterium]